MKKFFLFFLTVSTLLFLKAKAQEYPLGKLRLPSEAEILQTPQLKPVIADLKKNLPSRLDNTLLPYFRGVFTQKDGSCAQASGIGYNFTFEINRARKTNAKLPENQFPSHFTYNFLNDGDGSNGSFYTDGWDIIKAIGCPNTLDYGGMAINAQYWLNGYEHYENGFQNRVLQYYTIDVSNEEGLNLLKNWLANHLDNSEVGGLANFAAGMSGELNMINDSIIIEFGHSVNHAMTIVGWDDSIKYDFNNDGLYTNDKDINGDGVVDLKDWEKGALILVNSWGENWAANGKAYFMYRLLALPSSQGGIFANKVWVVKTYDYYPNILSLRLKIKHQNRSRLIITAGISQDTNATDPDKIMFLPVFFRQGGDLPMNGTDDNPLEIALDISKLTNYLTEKNFAKIFLFIREIDPEDEFDGEILEAKIKDLNGNIYAFPQKNIQIQNNTYTIISKKIELPDFNYVKINNEFLPDFEQNPYSAVVSVEDGQKPYNIRLLFDYDYEKTSLEYPFDDLEKLQPSDNDDGTAALELPFEFPYFGKKYKKIFVGTDGWIKFDDGFDFIRSEVRIANKKVLAVFASDLQIFDNQGIYYKTNDSLAQIVWKTGIFGDSTQNAYFSVNLYENGKIKMFYYSLPAVNWACGLSNANVYDLLIPNYSGTNIEQITDIAYVFEPVCMPSDMLLDTSNLTITANLDQNKSFWKIGISAEDYYGFGTLKYFYFGKKIAVENELFIYPNPADSYAILNLYSLKEQNANIFIYDLNGKLILSLLEKLKQGSNNILLNLLPSMARNVFIVKIKTTKNIWSGKLITF